MLAPPVPENEARRLAALQATGLLFTPAEERFDRITRLAARVFGTPIALVSLIADKCQWFKSEQGLGVSETPREYAFCGHAILGESTFVVEDAARDPRFADNPLVTGDPSIRFYAGHPLHAEDGSRVGTLCVIDRQPRQFGAEQSALLRDLAALAESELQRGQMGETQRNLLLEREEWRRKASIDGLTRLWNRAAIMELIGAELARARRGAPMCVAMVDADHFKSINDTHGHLVGDVVLVELAARIRRAVREFDVVGRYGGEEFIAVLSNCGQEAAEAVCERIRGFVADEPVATPAGPIRVTVSIGLACCHTGQGELEQVVGAADTALYLAKGQGRNRVEIEVAHQRGHPGLS